MSLLSRKYHVLTLVACFFFGQASAQSGADNAQYSQWDIESVAVYESGALIQRSADVALDQSGRAVVTIGGLAKSIDVASIQTVLPSGWGLSGHSFQIAKDPTLEASSVEQLSQLDEALESAERTVAMRNALLAVYLEELAMIQANRKVGGTESLLVEDLVDLANFWRDRVKELEYLMLELRMELNDLKEELMSLVEERQEVLTVQNAKEGQITLRMVGTQHTQGKVEIAYVAHEAFYRAAVLVHHVDLKGLNRPFCTS